MRTLKMRSTVASHSKLTTTNWDNDQNWCSYKLHEKLTKNLTSTILWSFGVGSKLKRWKSSISGCLMSWPQIKKIIILKCCLLLFYATTTNHFSIRLQRVLKSGISMTTGNNQLSGWTEKQLQSTSQSETCTRKGHGHCLVVCCPSEPLQPSESWQNHYTWEVCSANRWDALKMQCLQPALVNWKGPILPGHSAWAHITQPMLQKLSEFGYFCLTGYIHLTSRQPPTTSSSTSITFCRENASTTSRMQKMLSKSSSNSEAQIFMLQE